MAYGPRLPITSSKPDSWQNENRLADYFRWIGQRKAPDAGYDDVLRRGRAPPRRVLHGTGDGARAAASALAVARPRLLRGFRGVERRAGRSAGPSGQIGRASCRVGG